MKFSSYRRLALTMGVFAVAAFLCVPISAGAELVIRTGTFSGQWHSDKAEYTIDKVNPDGSFTGTTKLLDGPGKGQVHPFTGQLYKDNAIFLTRTDKYQSGADKGKTIEQESRAESPKFTDQGYVWKGSTTGKGLPNGCVFELNVPKEKDVEVDKAKLVGVWEVESAPKGSTPKGSTLEFTADGKITATIKGEVLWKGTYTIDGKTVKFSTEQGKSSVTIDNLTAKELVTIDEKKNKEVWLKVVPAVDKAKLVGVWKGEAIKGSTAEVTTEFTADGKFKVKIVNKEETMVVDGTYTIDGNTVKTENPRAKVSFTVEKLTAKELVIINAKTNKKEVFVKVD